MHFEAVGYEVVQELVLLEHDDDVPHEVVVQVIDAAKGARMDGVALMLP